MEKDLRTEPKHLAIAFAKSLYRGGLDVPRQLPNTAKAYFYELGGNEMHLRLASLWPGLAPAWYRGEGKALLLSIGFSWVLCWLLLATFVWPAWVSGWLTALAWLAVGCFWAFESIRGQFSLHRLLEDVAPDSEEAFSLAQEEYLRGRWFEAEARFLEILGRHPSDVAAGLMLVGVLRRTGRHRAALQRLEQMRLLDAAGPWRHEIMRELQLVQEAMDSKDEMAEADDQG